MRNQAHLSRRAVLASLAMLPTVSPFLHGLTGDTPAAFFLHNNLRAEIEQIRRLATSMAARSLKERHVEYAGYIEAGVAQLAAIDRSANLHGAVYQLRSPLAFIAGFAQLIRDQLPENDPARDNARRLDVVALRMADRIDALTDCYRARYAC